MARETRAAVGCIMMRVACVLCMLHPVCCMSRDCGPSHLCQFRLLAYAALLPTDRRGLAGGACALRVARAGRAARDAGQTMRQNLSAQLEGTSEG